MQRYVYTFRNAIETALRQQPNQAAQQMGGRLAVRGALTYSYFSPRETVRPQYLQHEEFNGHRVWAAHASGLLIADKPASMTIVSDSLDEHHLTQQLEFGREPDGRPVFSLRRTLHRDSDLRAANNWARVPRHTEIYDRLPPFRPHDLAQIEHAVAVTALRAADISGLAAPETA